MSPVTLNDDIMIDRFCLGFCSILQLRRTIDEDLPDWSQTFVDRSILAIHVFGFPFAGHSYFEHHHVFASQCCDHDDRRRFESTS